MKNGFYETRKAQMQSFARRFKRGKVSLAKVLADACICGAVEERFRCLDIIRDESNRINAAHEIVSRSVEDVLGYGKTGTVTTPGQS